MAEMLKRSSTTREGSRDMHYFKDSKANYLNRYAIVMSLAGEHQKAFDTLSRAVSMAESNPQSIETLRTLYKKVKGGDNGCEAYIASLQAEAYHKIFEEVEKSYISDDKVRSDIAVPDLNGKMVNLADYKGKILVIDFWATLCTPCVACFSGFEKVVADYRKDPFQLFVIDLFEDQATVKSYIAKKGITLDVLHDEPSIAGNKYGIDTKGTPTKIVFDPDGIERFESSGYSGSTDKEYYKLKAMVEITKARYKG